MKTWMAYDILNSIPHCWELLPQSKPLRAHYSMELENLGLITKETGPVLTEFGEEFLNFRGELHQIELAGSPVLISEDIPVSKAVDLLKEYKKKINRDVRLSLLRIQDYLDDTTK